MRLARIVAEAVSTPLPASYERPLERIWLAIAALILASLLVLALPPVVEGVCNGLYIEPLRLLLLENHSWLNRWAGFLKVLFEVLTAIAIGGAVFAQSLSNSIKTALAVVESNRKKVAFRQMNDLQRRVYRNLRTLEFLIVSATLTNVWRRLPTLMRASYSTYRLAIGTIPMSYWRFAIVVLPTGFPGGFYGLLAFFFLSILTAIKVVQIYLPLLHSV